jgi:hypothetical protein
MSITRPWLRREDKAVTLPHFASVTEASQNNLQLSGSLLYENP